MGEYMLESKTANKKPFYTRKVGDETHYLYYEKQDELWAFTSNIKHIPIGAGYIFSTRSADLPTEVCLL